MAAREINSQQTDVECIVNRWLVDYYVFLSLELFKKGQFTDFCAVRELLSSVLHRPVESTDVTPTKIVVLQFLCRINDGDKLDVFFESDRSVTPLESAINVLKTISPEDRVSQQEIENAITSIQEMLVVICIKNSEFQKAKAVLSHLPNGSKKAIFVDLIRLRSKKHEVLEQVTFSQFKQEMLEFCQKLCPLTVPFLYKAAKQLISTRLGNQEDSEAQPQPDKQDTSDLPSGLQITVQTAPGDQIIQKMRLEAAFTSLAEGSEMQSFVLLLEEMETESKEERRENQSTCLMVSPIKGMDVETESKEERRENQPTCLIVSPIKGMDVESKQDKHFQRDSGSPIEASPAHQAPVVDAVPQPEAGPLSKITSPPRNRRLHTVAQLVMEPDSQGSSQCSTASQELETEVRTKESPAIASKEVLQSSGTDTDGTKPTRKCLRKTRRTHSKNSAGSSNNEDDTHGAITTSNSAQTKESPQSPATAIKEVLQSSGTDTEVNKPTRKCLRKNSAGSSDNEDDTHGAKESPQSPAIAIKEVLQSSGTDTGANEPTRKCLRKTHSENLAGSSDNEDDTHGAKESPQSPAIAIKEVLQSSGTDTEVAKPTWKCLRKTRRSHSKNAAGLLDGEDDTHGAVATSHCTRTVRNQFTNSSHSKNSTEFTQMSSDSEEDPLGSVASLKTPLRKPRQRTSSRKSPSNTDDIVIEDSSLDTSPNLFLDRSAPQKSSTPQDGSPQNKGSTSSKWKQLYNNAKESKDTWSDEELLFSTKRRKDDEESTVSNSGQKRKKWTDKETRMLKEAVERFGEGNWNKIKAYYSFKDRTNVNLKDRWRTMKKLNLI